MLILSNTNIIQSRRRANANPFLFRFHADRGMPGNADFSRPSTATYRSAAGLEGQIAAAESPRLPHYARHPVSGVYVPTLLLEGGRTNLCSLSHTLSSWAQEAGSTVIENSAIAPNGLMEADTVTLPGSEGVYTLGDTATGVYTLSIWLRSDIPCTARIGVSAWNLAEKAVNVTSDWTRFTQAATLDGQPNFITLRKGISEPSITVEAWGAQLEPGPFTSSGIPTNGAPESRAADSLSFPWPHPPQEMSLYWRGFFTPSSPDEGGFIFDTDVDSVGASRVALFHYGGAYQLYHSNGASGSSSVAATPNIGDAVEVIGVMQDDGTLQVGVSVNGGPVTMGSAATSPAPAVTFSGDVLHLGRRWGNAGFMFSPTRDAMIAPGTWTLEQFRRYVSPDPEPDPVDPAASAWASASIANGGTVSEGTLLAASQFIKQLKAAGIWDKRKRINLRMGDYLASQVPIDATIGDPTDTYAGFISESYAEASGLAGPGSGGVGVDAADLSPNDITIAAYLRGRYSAGNNSTNALGTNTAWSELGVVMGYSGRDGGPRLSFTCRDAAASPNAYLTEALGLIAGSGRSTDSAIFQHGRKLSAGAAPTAGFASNEIRLPNQCPATMGGYGVFSALTDADHIALAAAWDELERAVRAPIEDTARRVVCVGDSLTDGMGPSFSQVSGPYWKQLISLRGWADAGTALYTRGVIGRAAADMAASAGEFTRLYYPGAASNTAIVWAGTNDLMNSNRSAAQVLGDLQTLCGALRSAGFSVVVVTLTPTISYGATYMANYNGQVGTVNTALSTGNEWTDGTYANAVAKIHTLTEMQDPDDTTYIYDGVHLTTEGYTAVAGVIDTELTALGV